MGEEFQQQMRNVPNLLQHRRAGSKSESLKEADEKLLEGLEWETKTSGQLGDIICLRALYH